MVGLCRGLLACLLFPGGWTLIWTILTGLYQLLAWWHPATSVFFLNAFLTELTPSHCDHDASRKFRAWSFVHKE